MLRKVLFLGTMLFTVVLMFGCGEDKNPVSPVTPQPKPPVIPGNVVINDSTFADSSMFIPFKLAINDTVTSRMRIDPSVGYYYKRSITSDSNNTSFVIPVFPQVVDSTVGLMFNLLAEKLCQTNFMTFLGQSNGSIGNTPYYIGIGFDRNDSIVYSFSISNYGDGSETKINIAAITPGKWYACAIEYNFTTQQIAFYLDGKLIGSGSLANGNIYGFDRCIVYRDGLGSDGPVPYYLNDVVVYKK